MISRCERPNVRSFELYGGRGITVCARWRASFEAFLADVGVKPSSAHSIERIDNNGHYEPGNVRWATPKEQANNRRDRTATVYEHDGLALTIHQWARHLGMSKYTIRNRIRRGLSVAEALSKEGTK